MKITSKLTYFLPFLILWLPSWYLAGIYTARTINGNYFQEHFMLGLGVALALTVLNMWLFFLAFVKLAPKFKPLVFKSILVAFPILLCVVLYRSTTYLGIGVIQGLLLLYAYILFNSRYIATLTDTSIKYKNLLGHEGEIPLTALMSLEQKRNILAIILLRRLSGLLDVSKQLAVGFRGENLDEYEIRLFVKVWQLDHVFHRIIDNSNIAGNLKVRQYLL